MVTLVVFGYELLQSKQNQDQQQEMLVVSDLNFDITTLARVYTHPELKEFSQHLANAAILKKKTFGVSMGSQGQGQGQASSSSAAATTTTALAFFGSKKERSKGQLQNGRWMGEVEILLPGDGAVILATKSDVALPTPPEMTPLLPTTASHKLSVVSGKGSDKPPDGLVRSSSSSKSAYFKLPEEDGDDDDDEDDEEDGDEESDVMKCELVASVSVYSPGSYSTCLGLARHRD